jgi:amino acid transporter
LTTLNPVTLFSAEGGLATVGAVMVLSFLGFVGFEASVVFSEESKNPKRTIALATFLSLGIIGAVYALTSWAMTVATGPDNLVGEIAAQDDPTQFIFSFAGKNGPQFFADAGTVLFVTSVVAATISFHNTVARYTFALGRAGVFPGALGSTGRRSGAPIGGSILATAVSLIAIVLFVVFDRDPLTELFFIGGNGGAVGILALVTLTSLAVLVFFLKNGRGENLFARIIAPVVAFLLLGPILYYAVDGFGGLIGNDGAVSWNIPAAYPIVGVLGVLYALVLRKARPEVYQAIGLGANSSTGITTQSKVAETAKF